MYKWNQVLLHELGGAGTLFLILHQKHDEYVDWIVNNNFGNYLLEVVEEFFKASLRIFQELF